MKRGPWQIALALTQLFNALTWGDGRHSFSARAGYALYRGKRWGKIAVAVIDAVFGRGHCERQAREEGLIA